eukprot:920037-Prymnesium_polylepis.1
MGEMSMLLFQWHMCKRNVSWANQFVLQRSNHMMAPSAALRLNRRRAAQLSCRTARQSGWRCCVRTLPEEKSSGKEGWLVPGHKFRVVGLTKSANTPDQTAPQVTCRQRLRRGKDTGTQHPPRRD